MTVDERLTAALAPFGYDIDNAVGFSKHDIYFTFNYNTLPLGFADDAPHYEGYLVQVHFFAPLDMNVSKLKQKIKRALLDAGFTWPSTTDASDEDGRHIVFECEIAEGVDEDGEL